MACCLPQGSATILIKEILNEMNCTSKGFKSDSCGGTSSRSKLLVVIAWAGNFPLLNVITMSCLANPQFGPSRVRYSLCQVQSNPLEHCYIWCLWILLLLSNTRDTDIVRTFFCSQDKCCLQDTRGLSTSLLLLWLLFFSRYFCLSFPSRKLSSYISAFCAE